MRIIVCGAQTPFMHGGAEMHRDNLVSALRAAGHEADLVQLPVAWEKDRLFDGAMAWRLVPADADMVIATNFPSYFVRHPNKVVWLFHQHRGAYDACDAEWSDIGLDPGSLETQQLLTQWDTVALREANKLFSTSARVAERLARYNGLTATPLYHPPPLHDRLRHGDFGDYVFCATRLEQNKRPGVAIEAFAKTTTDAKLEIAGTGSLRAELDVLASRLGVASRTHMLGFVDDDALIDRFAGALAVIYAPFDEDYGYVTLQAFLAGKPVITATDSGGVLEWVEDGVTGIITDGSADAIADAIDRLFRDRPLARKLGDAGFERVRDLSWNDVVAQLTA